MLFTIVEDDNGTIWFGGYSDGFAQYKNFSLSKYSSNQELPARILPGAAKLPNGDILFLAEDLPRYWIKKNNGSWRKLNLIVNKKRETRRAGYYVGQLNYGRIAIGMQTVGLGIVESIDDKEIIVNAIGKEKGVHLGNVLHFTQDSKDRVWMGRSTKGVAIYDMTLDTAITFKRIDTISNTFGAMSLAYDKSGTLWMGTNRGLAYISNASSFDPFTQNIFNHAQFITLPDGDQSLVTSVKIIDEYLVFGNNTSINFLDLHHFHENPNSAWIYQLRYGEDVSGNGTEQNCILEDSEGFLWVGTQEGALKIDIKKLPIDTTKPKISIVNISTGRGDLEIVKNQVQLPVDSRNLDITFGPDHNPSLMKNTFFDYMMTSSEGDTLAFRQYDRDGSLSLNYIPPENYSLNIIAKKHGQIIDKKSISISAPMSLSENPITWASLAIIIGGIGIGFITIRNRQKRRIAESELKLAKLESERKSLQVQSIISSFNPHFINNSLHWAQTKYRKDEEFTQLIDGLSSNIGYIFGMARQGKSWHKLKDEILLVNNYVEIQKVRFNNSFKFVLPNQDRLLRFQDFPVLLMQLQIHVENAIEHGLANRNKGSLVKIEIEEQERFLIFKITDDGCGRKKAKELGSSGTQMGTKMLKELYKIYNSENKIEHQLKTIYEDDIFEDEEGVKYGTRVIIELPKSFKYEN
jgi:hypothetical protein